MQAPNPHRVSPLLRTALMGCYALVLAGSLPAAEAKAAVRLPFVLLDQSMLDPEVVERLRGWAQSQLAVRVEIRRGEPAEGSLEERLRALPAPPDAPALAVVLLAEGREADAGIHGLVLPADRRAVVNVAALRAGDPDAERLARRLERCLLRNLAFLLEVPPAPDPFCATRAYRTLEDLDRMGRNFSPPTLQEFQRRAKAAGAELLDVPMLMIDRNAP